MSTTASKDCNSTTSGDATIGGAGALVTATRALSGWGRWPSFAECRVARPEKMAEFVSAVGCGGVLARGLGRSYGDAAVCADGVTVLSERVNRILGFGDDASVADGAQRLEYAAQAPQARAGHAGDALQPGAQAGHAGDALQPGVVRVEAGVSIAELLAVFVPRGWMPPVVPGTKFVSVGGAVAADIHGKNHHVDGSFSRSVESFELIDGTGRRMRCSRDENAGAFWATVGGMGLTGLVTDVTLRMKRIPSAFVRSTKVRAGGLDALMAAFDEHELQHPFSVAWIDCISGGARLGRGVLLLGDFVDGAELRWLTGKERVKKLPMDFPDFALSRFNIGLFNECFYAGHGGAPNVVHMDNYFFPLDSIHDWNRMYGKRGFVQYQCLFPLESSAAGLREVLTRSSSRGWGSFLAVLKRFGAAEERGGHASLSFPFGGYTLALDFPVRDGLAEFAAELDRIVLAHGGRLYLAKDSLMKAPTFEAMYAADLAGWRTVRGQLDPNGVFSSALSRRLGLTQ